MRFNLKKVVKSVEKTVKKSGKDLEKEAKKVVAAVDKSITKELTRHGNIEDMPRVRVMEALAAYVCQQKGDDSKVQRAKQLKSLLSNQAANEFIQEVEQVAKDEEQVEGLDLRNGADDRVCNFLEVLFRSFTDLAVIEKRGFDQAGIQKNIETLQVAMQFGDKLLQLLSDLTGKDKDILDLPEYFKKTMVAPAATDGNGGSMLSAFENSKDKEEEKEQSADDLPKDKDLKDAGEQHNNEEKNDDSKRDDLDPDNNEGNKENTKNMVLRLR